MPQAKARRIERFDVAIAGGGFVGRTLALALAKLAPKGFAIALIDAEPAQANGSTDARGLALSAATRNLLSVLDVWPELQPKAQRIESIEITDSSLDPSLRPHLLGFDAELKDGAARAEMVEHGDLSRALAKAV